MADYNGVGWGFFEGREQELTGTHVWLFCRLQGLLLGLHCTALVQCRTGCGGAIDGGKVMSVLTAQAVQELIRSGLPMAEDLDLRIDRLDSQCVIARVPFSGKLVRPGGTLSGPTMMALADAAMYAIVLGRLGRVEMAVTSNLNINFLQKPQPKDLLAQAQVLRLSKRQAVCEVLLYSAGNEDELVAHVTGTYVLPM